MKENSLYTRLIEYGKNGKYPFHMPGHKRKVKFLQGEDIFTIDITEIDGFDNLHHADGIIKEAMDFAAAFYGTDKTWFLVNGSSCGLLAAIHAVTNIGDYVIIGRNCHKSVYNAVESRNLKARYLYPEYLEAYGICGGYSPEKLENILKQCKKKEQKVKAVVLTSPTYEGIVSDIKRLAKITHQYGAVLIVDEAHGAHFGLHNQLPVPAYKLGADLVIESVHKTLPALTQSALLHMCGENIEIEKIEKSLRIYQTSSPSYPIMASIDKCIRNLRQCGNQKMEQLLLQINDFRKRVNRQKHFNILGREFIGKAQVFDIDLTKLVIFVDNRCMNGRELSEILRDRYNFEMEMDAATYVLGITTICDEKKDIERLAESLEELDREWKNVGEREKQPELLWQEENEIIFSAYEAGLCEMEECLLKDSVGCVSGEYLYLYPPEIPLLVPGEIISPKLLEQIERYKKMNMNIRGLKDTENQRILVINKNLYQNREKNCSGKE